MWNQGARFLVVVVAVAGALTLGGCTVAVSESPAVDSSATSGRGDLPVGNDPVQLNPAEFTTEIDNPYWPMKPGTRWTYREDRRDR